MRGHSLRGNREVSWLAVPVRDSPRREEGASKPMRHGREQSDTAIVPQKPANNVGRHAAEQVEGRAGPKGNTSLRHTYRTQGRAHVSQALARVRQAVRRDKTQRMTALFHHLTVDCLREAYYALKRDAAPGVDGVTWEGFVKLLRLRCSCGKRVPLPGPIRPLGGPLRACHFGPTRASLPHLLTIGGR